MCAHQCAEFRKEYSVGSIAAHLPGTIQLNLLMLNPADRVTTPKKPASVATAWSADEARHFLAVARDHAYQPYWTLALRLGLRPSELLGLRWECVDLDHATLTVRDTRVTIHGITWEGAPKTDAGNRVLDLPPDVVTMLRAHYKAQLERQKQIKDLWVDMHLVCAGDCGQPINLYNLRRAFKRLRTLAGVSDIRLFDLRHTAITLMAAGGADMKAVSEVAGHANVMITRNIYQHINRKQRCAALGALTGALGDHAEDVSEGISNA